MIGSVKRSRRSDTKKGGFPPLLLLLAVDPDFCRFGVCDLLVVDWSESRVLAGVLAALARGDFEVERFKDDRFDFVGHLSVSRGVSATSDCKETEMAVKKIRVRKPYDPSEDPGIAFDPEEGLTQQQFKEECDVNNIMRRYNATGVITHVNTRVPEWGDFSSPVDFQTGLNTVIEAQAMFNELSAELRERFGNDPLKLLEFVADEANREEAVKLGIVQPEPPPPEPQLVRVVQDDGSASSPLESPQPA